MRHSAATIDDFMHAEPGKGTFQHMRWQLACRMESTPIRIFFISLVCINGIMIGEPMDFTVVQ